MDFSSGISEFPVTHALFPSLSFLGGRSAYRVMGLLTILVP